MKLPKHNCNPLSRTICRGLLAFSLAEVIFSVAIVGVSGAALFAGVSSGFTFMKMARENQRAIQILLDKTETVRLYNWDQVSSNGFIPISFTATADSLATGLVSPNTIYTGDVSIVSAPINASYSNDMKQLTVTLTWKTGAVLRNRQLTTFIGRNGLQNYIY